MKKKVPEMLPKVDRFVEAAQKAGVPVEVFRLWALRSLRSVSPKQWSHWETGLRPIPGRIIIKFLRERQEPTVISGAPREHPRTGEQAEQDLAAKLDELLGLMRGFMCLATDALAANTERRKETKKGVPAVSRPGIR